MDAISHVKLERGISDDAAERKGPFFAKSADEDDLLDEYDGPAKDKVTCSIHLDD